MILSASPPSRDRPGRLAASRRRATLAAGFAVAAAVAAAAVLSLGLMT